jgi:hypothetical protein
MILGGDFNCVLSKSDCTGQFNNSRALNALVSGYALIDMRNPERGIYIHYSRQGASRLDRIYVTKKLRNKKKGIETVVAAFQRPFSGNSKDRTGGRQYSQRKE